MAQRYLLVGGTAVLAMTMAVSSAAANLATQLPTQTYDFLPWQGCWRAEGAPGDERLCIVSDRSAGMRMVTVVNGESVAESRIIADGRARPVEQAECKGTEQARWSSDRQRLFLTSSLTCGENVNRDANGLFVFTAPGEWLSIQSVTVGDQTAVRTTRYTAADMTGIPAALRSAFANAPTREVVTALQEVDENDVNEAARYLDAAVVQEWLDATELPFAIAAADELSTSSQAPYTSALDQVGRMSNPAPKVVREVHVVERPVVHHTYVTHVVRSCWDPFWGGHCGHRYYSRYSPWGYDPFRWRVVWAPLVIVRNPIIIRRSRDHYRRSPNHWRDRDDDWRGGRATRDGYRSSDRNRDRDQNQSRDRDFDRDRNVGRTDPVRITGSPDPRRAIARTTARPTEYRDNTSGDNRVRSIDRSSGNSGGSSRSPVVRSSSGSRSTERAASSSGSGRSTERPSSSGSRRATARSSRGN